MAGDVPIKAWDVKEGQRIRLNPRGKGRTVLIVRKRIVGATVVITFSDSLTPVERGGSESVYLVNEVN